MTSEPRDTIEIACARLPCRWRLAFSNRFREFEGTSKYDAKTEKRRGKVSVVENIRLPMDGA